MRGWPSFIKKTIAVSLSAQIFTLPLIVYHLNQLNTISLISNIIIIPLTTVFIYVSLIALLLILFIPSVSYIGPVVTNYVYSALTQSGNFFADFHFNFFLDGIGLFISSLLALSLIPLLPSKIARKTKIYPVIAAFILTTFYLKYPSDRIPEEITLTTGESSVTVIHAASPSISIDVKDYNDTDLLLQKLRSLNLEIRVINVLNNSSPNLTACRKLCNDFIIDECRFSALPDINGSFKNLIYTLEADKVKVSFAAE